MYKGLVQLPETKYLGFGIMMPWENNLEIQFGLWQQAVDFKKIEALKELCGSEQAIGIFCYRCDEKTQTFSYHIACENKNKAVSAEFEELKIDAGTFAQFENTCQNFSDRFKAYNDLCDEIWGKWLPNSDYISLIELETLGSVEGYASLEVYKTGNPTAVPYQFEILLPVKRKS
ncbi:MAG: GyrI-like domain-containing protein [Eubacterium sp.]|nr:GyrI-like domain-containing protein [Eubacterium sp.]